NLNRQRITVRIANLCWARSGLDLDNFVAGGEHRNSRASVDFQLRFAHRRGQSNGHLIQPHTWTEQSNSVRRLRAARNNVLPWRHVPGDLDPIPVTRGVLDHYYRIRAR